MTNEAWVRLWVTVMLCSVALIFVCAASALVVMTVKAITGVCQ